MSWQNKVWHAVEGDGIHQHTHTLDGIENAVLIEVNHHAVPDPNEQIETIKGLLDDANVPFKEIKHVVPSNIPPRREFIWVTQAYVTHRDMLVQKLNAFAVDRGQEAYVTLKEYIQEAEHQDGIAYWRYFITPEQAYEDFKQFCIALGMEGAEEWNTNV